MASGSIHPLQPETNVKLAAASLSPHCNEVQLSSARITCVSALPSPEPVPPAREWYMNIPRTLSAASISRRTASRVGLPSSDAAAKPSNTTVTHDIASDGDRLATTFSPVVAAATRRCCSLHCSMLAGSVSATKNKADAGNRRLEHATGIGTHLTCIEIQLRDCHALLERLHAVRCRQAQRGLWGVGNKCVKCRLKHRTCQTRAGFPKKTANAMKTGAFHYLGGTWSSLPHNFQRSPRERRFRADSHTDQQAG
jgi:hypothetical protein